MFEERDFVKVFDFKKWIGLLKGRSEMIIRSINGGNYGNIVST